MGIKVTASTVVERDGGFLLVKESTDEKRRFNLPGGGQKKRESIEDAAVRETEEESGLLVRLDRLVGIHHIPRTRARNNLTRFVFGATQIGGLIRTSEKHPEVDFFSYKEVKKMYDADQISSLSVLRAIQDYRKGRGVDLSIFTGLPRVKRKLLIPKHLIDPASEDPEA
jgi:ADP-ribose pyrophosphatase YjhB (NUDIX family)